MAKGADQQSQDCREDSKTGASLGTFGLMCRSKIIKYSDS